MAGTDRETPTLDELVTWLEAHPCNRDGADKTWVLDLMRRLERLFRDARLLEGRGPDGRLR